MKQRRRRDAWKGVPRKQESCRGVCSVSNKTRKERGVDVVDAGGGGVGGGVMMDGRGGGMGVGW